MKDQINIVIADAQPIFLSGLLHAMQSVPTFKIIGEAADGETALSLINDQKPDVAILDPELPEKDGIEIARIVFAHSIQVNLMFLTTHRSRSYFNAALNLGVKGYVLKSTPASYLVDAVKTVSEGKLFISPVLSNFLVKRSRRRRSLLENIPAVSLMTTTERQILVLISQFMTSRAIADELFISVRTVEHHREHIAAKLGLQGRNSLLKFAIDHKDEIT